MDVTNITEPPVAEELKSPFAGTTPQRGKRTTILEPPLWVVDRGTYGLLHFPVTGTNGLADLNPEVIESIKF